MEELLEKAGKKPSDVAWKAYMAGVAPLSVYKLVVAPPGTPDAIMNTLITAYEKTGQDPKFKKTWKKLVSPILNVGTGKETGKLLSSSLKAEPEVMAYMNELRRRSGVIK